jgi:hypothetical protein
MSITTFLQATCTQDCVYWGNPHEDGYGGITYDDPIELKCRWEDKIQVLGAITGNQVLGYQETSRATVYVLQDVDQDGRLYLGTLDSLDNYLDSSDGSYVDPNQLENTFIIKRFEKSPALGSTTEFLRKAFLTPWLS